MIQKKLHRKIRWLFRTSKKYNGIYAVALNQTINESPYENWAIDMRARAPMMQTRI